MITRVADKVELAVDHPELARQRWVKLKKVKHVGHLPKYVVGVYDGKGRPLRDAPPTEFTNYIVAVETYYAILHIWQHER